MEPTVEQRNGMVCLQDVCEWAGLSDVIAAQPDGLQDSPRSAFYKALGAEAKTHWRVLASVKKEKFDQMKEGLQINGQPPSIAVDGQIGLIWEVCQLLGGLRMSREEEALERAAKRKKIDMEAAAPKAAAPKENLKKIKLSMVINQVDDEEIDVLQLC